MRPWNRRGRWLSRGRAETWHVWHNSRHSTSIHLVNEVLDQPITGLSRSLGARHVLLPEVAVVLPSDLPGHLAVSGRNQRHDALVGVGERRPEGGAGHGRVAGAGESRPLRSQLLTERHLVGREGPGVAERS